MNTAAIASDFFELCKHGKLKEAGAKHWSKDVVSVEPMGDQRETSGIDAVAAKGEWWRNAHTVHAMTLEGPYVSPDQFVMRFLLDVTVNATGQRTKLDEVGIYHVRGGQVVRETFLFNT